MEISTRFFDSLQGDDHFQTEGVLRKKKGIFLKSGKANGISMNGMTFLSGEGLINALLTAFKGFGGQTCLKNICVVIK